MRTLITLVSLLPAWAFSQCTHTVQVTAQMGCSGGNIQVNTSSGFAPFSIVVDRMPQQTQVEAFTNDADGDLVASYSGTTWDATSGCRITVTDVNGCAVTAFASWAPFTWPFEWASTEVQCASGVYQLVMDFQGSPRPCSIDGGPVIQPDGNWTFLTSPERHRYNGVLAPGPHIVSFPEGVVAGFNYCATSYNVTVPVPISAGDCGVNLRVRAALGGAMSTGSLMSDALRTSGLVPVSEPFSALGYVYTGAPANASIPPALLAVAGDNAIVDWMILELRSAATPAQVLFSKAVLIQRDGDIIDPDGDPYVNCPLSPGNYRIALRHRNHLAVMSAFNNLLGVDPVAPNSLIDFRIAAGVAFGATPLSQINSIWCLWAGDATGDGTLKYTGANNDRDLILVAIGGSTPNAVLTNVYDRRDTNLDGVIKYTGSGNDRDIILTNVGSTTPNTTRTQQLP
ncbi:MAG: hypothetical protein U0U25_11290 [Flavobacteriales bacterium]